MEKAKKILFLLAGLIKTIGGSLITLLTLLILLLGKIIRQFFEMADELIEQFITEVTTSSDEYDFLLEYSKAEQVDYIIDLLNKVAIVALIWSLIMLALGIINLVYCKKYPNIPNFKQKGIVLVVCSWLITWLNLSNILTTIAVFLKKKQKSMDKVESQSYNS